MATKTKIIKFNNITKRKFLLALFKAISRTYYAEIVKGTPGKGMVREGWDIDITSDGVTISNKEYGDIIKYLEEGTSPHIIRAKNKKFLRFKKPKIEKTTKSEKIPGNVAFEKDGYIFAKAVRHPGYEARKWIYDILNSDRIEKEFQRALEREIDNIIAG